MTDQLSIILWQRFETQTFIFFGMVLLLGLAINGLLLYLTFSRGLIPLARYLCNYARAWQIDLQYRPRPGHENQSSASH